MKASPVVAQRMNLLENACRVGVLAAMGLAGCGDDDVSVAVREFRADRTSLAPGESVTLTWAIRAEAHIPLFSGVSLFRGEPDEQGPFAEDSDLAGELGQEKGTFLCFYSEKRVLACYNDEDSAGVKSPGNTFSLPAGAQTLTLRACALGIDGSAEARTHHTCDDEVLTLTLL